MKAISWLIKDFKRKMKSKTGTWAVTGAAAIGAAGSIASSALAPKGGGGGPSVVSLPTFDFFEPGAKEASDFQRQQLASLSQGQFPQFFQNAIPQLRQELQQPLTQRFFGTEGNRGGSILDTATAAGAMSGLGPRRLASNVNKSLRDFSDRSQSIDRFITQQGVDLASNFARSVPDSLFNAPQGPPATAFAGGGGGGGGGGTGSAVASGLGDAFGAFVGGGGFNKPNTIQKFPDVTPANSRILNSNFNSGGGGFGISANPIGSNFGIPKEQPPASFKPLAINDLQF